MSLLPDVTELLIDPDLGAQTFFVKRRKGKWSGGRLAVSDEEALSFIGIIQPPSSEQLAFFPEGERREGRIVIYTQSLLHLTEGEDISDDVIWSGESYKVVAIDRWTDYGFCAAYAQKR